MTWNKFTQRFLTKSDERGDWDGVVSLDEFTKGLKRIKVNMTDEVSRFVVNA